MKFGLMKIWILIKYVMIQVKILIVRRHFIQIIVYLIIFLIGKNLILQMCVDYNDLIIIEKYFLYDHERSLITGT